MTTVYVTTHAITKGIEEAEGSFSGSAFRYAGLGTGNYSRFSFAPANHVFVNRGDAVVNAERMRDERVASLRRQIERLESLTFE